MEQLIELYNAVLFDPAVAAAGIGIGFAVLVLITTSLYKLLSD